MRAIIGHTGFVGSNIIEHMDFDYMFNTKNIQDITLHEYDLIVCTGISALKWYANQNAEEDLEKIKHYCDLQIHLLKNKK